MTAFFTTTAKIGINPTYSKALKYALKDLCIKFNDIKKNIKDEGKILRFAMHRNTKDSK
jgi:hypothetical protein